MPKISVIIPVYNSEKYIGKCIDSIICQTLNDIEIICVNDCSKDKSFDIIKQYADNDSRFVLIENEKNHKQGYCRNIGILLAKSDYIHFLDSDDWIEDINFYEEAYNEITENDIDLYVFNNYEYHNEEEKLVENEKEKRFPFIYSDINSKTRELTGMAWDKVYSKKFITENNICFAEDVYWEDILFNFLLKIHNPRIKVTDKKYIVYRLNAAISTTTNILDIYKDSIRMAEMSKEILVKNNMFEKYKNEFINTYIRCLYSDISKRVKDKSEIKYIFMKRDIKNFFKSLNLSEEDLQNFKKYNHKAYKTLMKLKKYSILKGYLIYFVNLIFSIRNSSDKKNKIITLLGLNFKYRRKHA